MNRSSTQHERGAATAVVVVVVVVVVVAGAAGRIPLLVLLHEAEMEVLEVSEHDAYLVELR